MRYSVITINYNNADGLHKTIQSVVSQTSKDYEYIVIDGGSSDGSIDVIKKYADQIHYWVSERDKGIYNAMNKGIAQAQGDYCIFMNSGDIFYDDKVLERVSKNGCTEEIIVGTTVTDDNRIMSPNPTREISLYHLYSGAISHQASFISTKKLKSNPYDEGLRIVSDWKFFVQEIIINNCSFRFIDEYVAIYDTTGVSSVNSEKMLLEKKKVLSELFPPRVLADYAFMKSSECLTQTITPELRKSYRIDKLLYKLGSVLLGCFSKKDK